MNSTTFNYDVAFSRTIGWISQDEATILKTKRIAIAGMGGVGGSHLIALSRLGIQNFHIADMDQFAVENFNRQAGASMSTIDKDKVYVMSEMAKDINPESNIKIFDKGVHENNIDEFLDGVDIYIDGLDFFAFKARINVFDACEKKKIPVVTVAPLGVGAALLNFIPGKMGHRDYFNMKLSLPDKENAIRFAAGLAPSLIQASYLVDKSTVSLENKKGPSTPMACYLCSGVAAAEAMKILLKRGKITAVPQGVHFDAYKQKLKKTYIPFGFHNPLQKLKRFIMRRMV